MKAEDRYEVLEAELRNLITPMSPREQDLLMKAIRWACRDNNCGRMSALHKLLVWQDPDTNVGGIWCIDDVEAYLRSIKRDGVDTSFITLEHKRELLDEWYDFISENENNLWEDFLWNEIEWIKQKIETKQTEDKGESNE